MNPADSRAVSPPSGACDAVMGPKHGLTHVQQSESWDQSAG